ncbi:MAG: hypothetical protein AABW54_00785 [Candidatus Micrarchaeota archaeon]
MTSDDALEGRENEDVFEGYFLSRALNVNFNYLFFPGLVMHELAHYAACVIAGSRVFETVLWSPRGGHVVHTRVRASSSVLISLFPFFLNNFLAVLLLQDAAAQDAAVGFAFLWLAFSFAIYSIPSVPDLKNSVDAVKRSYTKRRGFGLAATLFYIPLFAIHYILLLPLLFFSRHRTLRIVWFLMLYAAVSGGMLSA